MGTVLVDYRIESAEKYALENLGFEVLVIPPSQILYAAVCGHPDMLLHIIDKKTVMVHKDMDINFINKLETLNMDVLVSYRSLQNNYPHNVILNAVHLDNLFIHNTRYTDTKLLECVKNKKVKSIKQGYSKCSTAIVSNNAIMTSDKGIANCAQEEGVDVLLLPPGDILLPGLDYGFIGGCCGLIEESILAFYGDLKYYAYGKEVMKFLSKHDVKPVFLRDDKLTDRGSIFVL
jgi:hypothetical protein